ncbi:hypothetical protein HY418_02610 [Candidatus Kaiserbacteria bacterium]|nr:hypothetical protein [Candidatus Kaiserbacteria bacterium]
MSNISRTQIVATLGPATESPKTIASLIAHQMDVVRINMSWGSHEEATRIIERVREAAEDAGRRIPIMLDLAGPRVQEKEGHHFAEGAITIITDKDVKDIEFGIAHAVEYFAESFVEEAQDVERLSSILKEKGSNARIVAKIERQRAIDNLDVIIAATDVIMVARGDLGNELPLERIPFVQSTIIKKANAAKKPVIVATELLPSMVDHHAPTRSDVTDIAFAVLMGADALMLSDETAIGKFPVEAVAVMERVVMEAERHGPSKLRLAL